MKVRSLYRYRQRNGKKGSGQGLVEVVTTLALLTPVVLILIDCVFIGIGCAINDSVCRDAARAAASGPPGFSGISTNRTVAPGESPYRRAMAVTKKVYDTRLPMKVKETLTVVESVADVPPATMGGAVDGMVSVETVIDIYPPFLVGTVVGESGISLKTKHQVPITYVLPAS